MISGTVTGRGDHSCRGIHKLKVTLAAAVPGFAYATAMLYPPIVSTNMACLGRAVA